VGERAGLPVFDNTRRLARIAYRIPYYTRILRSSIGHIPVATMLRSHFPFAFFDNERPAYVTIEFTNYCNLSCSYCTSPLGIRTRGMMAEDTFALLLTQLKDLGIARVRIVGNGEPTLHPQFCDMVDRLAHVCRYLQLVTNGQTLDRQRATAVLAAPVRLLEISADDADPEGYEKSRVGGRFSRLVENLARLRELKRDLGSPTLIGVRAMIRPSQRPREQAILSFWKLHADTVAPQYVHDYTRGNVSDVFPHVQQIGTTPRCGLPFNAIIVYWNGKIPICELSQQQIGVPGGLVAGDVHEQSLRQIWKASLFRRFREGHKGRREDLIPICRGCEGG
jgi:MoaA/NifB/PqqE/SkfB family radical SAM enzyme